MITFHYVRLLLLISCSITQILGLFLPHVRRHQSSHHYVAHISPILSTVTDGIQRCLLEVGRASSVRGIRRNTCISRPSSSLYSSAVEDCDSGHREVEVVNSDFDDRPINLFHSVLCGSDGINVAVEPSSTISARTKFSRGKAPIIVLPGLLGSARNFQSWIKLVQQCEIEQDNIHADKEETESTHFETRDIICMDLRNHGRTGVYYGSLKMDFDLMARDVIHTLRSLGLTKVHLVGHSLGGKVAAVAALKLANQVDDSSDIRILSMTMIDVSPVDYDSEEAFEDVFRTVDIVNELDAELSLVGATPNKPSDDSSSVSVRSALNTLLSERITDPMLKAFLLASIQPKEIRLDPSVGGLSARIRTLMRKIELHRSHLSLQQQQTDKNPVGGVGADIASLGTLNAIPTGFEWKFSVRGIVAFRGELGAWPSEFSRRRVDTENKEENVSGTLDPVSVPFLNPVLLMKGGTSKFVRSSHIPSISLLFPNFTLMTVREAGHWLHFEKPKESSELLMKFIRTVEDRM